MPSMVAYCNYRLKGGRLSFADGRLSMGWSIICGRLSDSFEGLMSIEALLSLSGLIQDLHLGPQTPSAAEPQMAGKLSVPVSKQQICGQLAWSVQLSCTLVRPLRDEDRLH